jgi:hypothetical protein
VTDATMPIHALLQATEWETLNANNDDHDGIDRYARIIVNILIFPSSIIH